MKWPASLVALLIPFTVVMVAPGSAKALFGVRISGGYSYITYCDYNKYADYMNSEGLPQSGIAGATYDNLNWIPEFKAELTTTFIPRVESGFGAGALFGTADFSFSMAGIVTLDYEHKVHSYPFTYTAYFSIPVPLTSISPLVYGGIGAYYSTLTFSEYTTGLAGLGLGLEDSRYTAELTKWSVGFHGGAGIKFSVAPTISVDISVFGRWAKATGFEGTLTTEDGDTEDVFLVNDTVEDMVGDPPILVSIPYYGAWPVVEKDKYSEGEVDLSGYGFAVGLSIGF